MDFRNVKNKYKHTLYDNAIRARLHYYKNMKDELDAQKAKAKNILLRKQILESQNRNNYQLEYDRIRGQSYDNNLIPSTRQYLQRRRVELERLGAQAIDSIK